MEAGTIDRIKFYTGATEETGPGNINVGSGSTILQLGLSSPQSGQDWGNLLLSSGRFSGNPAIATMRLVRADGSERAYFSLYGQTTSGTEPRLQMGGIDQVFVDFLLKSGSIGNQVLILGNGGDTLLHLYANGYSNRLCVNGAITTGMFIMNGSSSSFRPILASSFDLSSSMETKKNIVPDPESGLERVMKMKPVHFQRREALSAEESSEHAVRNHTVGSLGFLVEELQSIVPQAVKMKEGNIPVAIDLSSLLCVTIQAVQELAAKIEQMEKK
jgi:hypothetical protein